MTATALKCVSLFQYAYYKRMCQAAVLIQNQFRSYVEHKRAGAGSGNALSSRIKTNERFKRNKHSPVLVNQKFRYASCF